jgi:hypothetical protein
MGYSYLKYDSNKTWEWEYISSNKVPPLEEKDVFFNAPLFNRYGITKNQLSNLEFQFCHYDWQNLPDSTAENLYDYLCENVVVMDDDCLRWARPDYSKAELCRFFLWMYSFEFFWSKVWPNEMVEIANIVGIKIIN